MSKSWGWKVVPFTQADLDYYARQRESKYVADHPTSMRYYVCRKKGCGQHPSVWVQYSYVTGRAGRVSWQQKPYCQAHGEQIVADHSQPEAA